MADRQETTGGAHARFAGLAVWISVLVLVTAGLWALREELEDAHKTLVLLVVVLGASARHGRSVGLALAGLAFLAFNFFLLAPYYSLRLANGLDWIVLVGFLITGAVAAQLFHRAQQSRAVAERGARDAERFASMAAESLAAATAAESLQAIIEVMRAELPIRSVQIFGIGEADGVPFSVASVPEGGTPTTDSDLVRFALRENRLLALETNATTHVAPERSSLGTLLLGPRTHAGVIVPLYIHDRPIGAVCIAHPDGLLLDRGQLAFAEGFIRYAALALERARLATEAERVAVLEHADRLKDAFVASVSHDLRTPLTTIRALASEMRDVDPDRASVIVEEVERLNRIVSDVLDLSRVRAGAVSLDPQIVAAEDLVGAALQRIAGVPGSERIAVRLPPDGSLPVGRLDFVQTLRILSNLLENALRHAHGTDPIELVVESRGDHLVFRVLDRGPGIQAADAERVFAPFTVLKSSGNPQPGTGLGLAIARSLAVAQGGTLEHEPREGGGSVFVLTLPAAAIPDLA